MNFTFNNSSIVSVNSGTIVLNVSGKTRTFVDAKLVSIIDGKIILDLSECSYTKGTYAVLDTGSILIIQTKLVSLHGIKYYVSQTRSQKSSLKYNDYWSAAHFYRNATPEEIQELNDQLAAEGKCWNPDTIQIEKLKWKPLYNDTYYCIIISSYVTIITHIWKGDYLDRDCYKSNNCFKTKEEAEAKLEKIKQILNSTI